MAHEIAQVIVRARAVSGAANIADRLACRVLIDEEQKGYLYAAYKTDRGSNALGLSASAAQAQDVRPVNVSLGGGWTIPAYPTSRTIWAMATTSSFGVQVNVKPTIGIEGLLRLQRSGRKRISIPVSGNPDGSGAVPTDFSGP